MPATYLEVNIPSHTLTFINGKLRNNFKVFVGKISSPSPVLNSEITSLKTNSDAILESKNIKKELLPTMFRNPEYLIRNHFDIFNNNGKYIQPSPSNMRLVEANPTQYYALKSSIYKSLIGNIVFHFDNSYHIYLYGSPAQKTNKGTDRAVSSGSIRIENSIVLVSLLMSATNSPKSVQIKIQKAIDRSKKLKYTFSKPIPVFVRYITCEARNGTIIFYPDIYKKDKALIDKMFGSMNFITTSM